MSRQPNRLAEGGRIDRTKTLSLTFDGQVINANPGDTLASALMANGVNLVARSFKYHRPRGIFSAGVEEPNALVTLRAGARTEPNSRATVIEVFDGLEAVSQNRWPTLKADFGAVNNLAARFLPAGFYYKTFIGQGRGTKAWMFYEKFIRRAAGMGRATKESDPDKYEKVNGFCDVLVIGAGPAGLCAALRAGQTGANVVLAEQDFEIGGSLLSEPVDSDGANWLSEIIDQLTALPNVRILKRTTVFGAYDAGVFGLVERVWDHVAEPPPYQPRQRFHLIRTKAAVLAAGAIEQPFLFGSNDLPGVMLAAAARCYVNRFAILPGKKIVVVANNDSAFTVARDLAASGACVTYIDSRQNIDTEIAKTLSNHGVEIVTGHAIWRARGRRRVTAVDIVENQDGKVDRQGATRRITADLIATSAGWAPSCHLWSHLGHKPVFNSDARVYFPDEAKTPQMFFAGMVASDGSEKSIPFNWFDAGSRAAAYAGFESADAGISPILANIVDAMTITSGLADGPVIAQHGSSRGKVFIDLQHDTTLEDIELGDREGLNSIEHMKRYTTAGMATDQGKTTNLNMLASMAQLQRTSMGEIGTTRFRPPYTPVSFGAVIGPSRGLNVAPTRIGAIQDWHIENGADFIAAGAWQRPWYYPQEGETLGDAYIREATHVRQYVGLIDVSTLGKIAIQGPDASTFLDRVYANGFKTLKVGRIRYGVMLREDGLMFDDGTIARIADNQYLMSTTTANAAAVLSHLEYFHQTAWPHLKVHLTSVTDQWATIAVAGPKSRMLLQDAAGGADLSATRLPNMAIIEVEIEKIPVRIHRMSFSGELAYEVYVGSGWGHSVWVALMQAGDLYDVIPYGTEAMGTLRIEKGHVSAPELDGRTTIDDLGMGRMASKRKSYIGSALRGRQALCDPDRSVLVGIESLDDQNKLKPGMLLFSDGVEISGHGEGHVSSVTWSPALNRHIGLGLLAGGPTRHGEIICCVNLLENQNFPVRVTSPHFFDPEGERQNG